MERYETSSDLETTYELPSGQEIMIGNGRFKCCEALFQPSFLKKKSLGLHELVFRSIEGSDGALREEFYKKIVLAGGNSMFEGLGERLEKEVGRLTPKTREIKVEAPPERKYTAWIGGSLFSALPNFEKIWISKENYDEMGPSLVHRKCI